VDEYSIIPDWIFRESDFTRAEILVTIALVSAQNLGPKTSPTITGIALYARLSERATLAAMASLEHRGHLKRAQNPTASAPFWEVFALDLRRPEVV
jgi:hypothetical protein